MDPKLLGSRVTVRVDGQRLPLESGATIELGGIESEPVTTDDPGDVYYSEVTKPSVIEGKLMVPTGMNLNQVAAISNASILVETVAGHSFVVNGARQAGILKLEKGMTPVKFIGPAARQIK